MKSPITSTTCRAKSVPVFVHPARAVDFAKYRGGTTITPNRTGVEIAPGIPADHNSKLAEKLLSELNLDTVVLTLDRHGALLLERDEHPATCISPTRSWRHVPRGPRSGPRQLALLGATAPSKMRA